MRRENGKRKEEEENDPAGGPKRAPLDFLNKIELEKQETYVKY
jgi:hypothetical protein